MAIALDDAPVTLNRPLLDGETLAVTLRRGVGRAGVRLVSETTAYTVWIETSGIAVLERDGAEQGRVPVAGDAQRVTLTYASGTLTASVGAYAFPPISDGTVFASLRAEFVVQGGNGQGSTFDEVTVPLPPGLMPTLPVTTAVPTAFYTPTPYPTTENNVQIPPPQLLSNPPADVRYRLVNAGDEVALYAAIEEANNGLVDEIYLNANLSIPTSGSVAADDRTYFLDRTINIANTLTVYGNNTILRPQSTTAPVYPLLRTFPAGHLIASHIHLTRSTVTVNNSYAAGIANLGRLTLRDSSLTTLRVVAGGAGLYNTGTAVLERVRLEGNDAGGGAGIQNDVGGQLNVTCSQFVNNAGNYGVAILNGNNYNNASSITVTHSIFQNNRSRGGNLSDIYNIEVPITIMASQNFWASGPPAVTGPNIVTSNPLTADPTIPDANGTWTHPECEPQLPVYVPADATNCPAYLAYQTNQPIDTTQLGEIFAGTNAALKHDCLYMYRDLIYYILYHEMSALHLNPYVREMDVYSLAALESRTYAPIWGEQAAIPESELHPFSEMPPFDSFYYLFARAAINGLVARTVQDQAEPLVNYFGSNFNSAMSAGDCTGRTRTELGSAGGRQFRAVCAYLPFWNMYAAAIRAEGAAAGTWVGEFATYGLPEVDRAIYDAAYNVSDPTDNAIGVRPVNRGWLGGEPGLSHPFVFRTYVDLMTTFTWGVRDYTVRGDTFREEYVTSPQLSVDGRTQVAAALGETCSQVNETLPQSYMRNMRLIYDDATYGSIPSYPDPARPYLTRDDVRYGMSTEYSRSANALVIESQSARDGNGQLIPLPFSLSFENPIGNIGSLSWQTYRFTRPFTGSDTNFPTDRPILHFLNGLEPVPTMMNASGQSQRVEFVLCP